MTRPSVYPPPTEPTPEQLGAARCWVMSWTDVASMMAASSGYLTAKLRHICDAYDDGDWVRAVNDLREARAHCQAMDEAGVRRSRGVS